MESILEECGESPLLPDDPNSIYELNSTINDFNVSIALKKGVRTYAEHPISNFISYDSLSPSYRAFVLFVSSVSIPQDWKKACLDPK